MYNGAPEHLILNMQNYLTLTYGNHWIGRGEPHAWSPRNPNLIPWDFYQRISENLVYTTRAL